MIATALLLTVLSVGTDQAPIQAAPPAKQAHGSEPSAQGAGDAPAHPVPPHDHQRPLDPRHRIEARFGGWGDGWYNEGPDWSFSGTAHGVFGLEYLSFLRNDFGVGVGLSSLVRANGFGDDWSDSGAAQITTCIPVVVRWYPARRLTNARSVEPYVTAGIGPVFGIDTIYTDRDSQHGWHDDGVYSTHVGTTIGGRVGGGVDFRLGSVFTLGVAGAWNWDAGFSDDLWRGTQPSGGEFSVVLGWMFGR